MTATLDLPRTSSCVSCARPIAAHVSRNRGQLSTSWESVSGSTVCFAADQLTHTPVGDIS